MYKFCCRNEDSKRWKNCNWYGKPGSCYDNHCPALSAVQLTSSDQGGGDGCGWTGRQRVYCCEPTGGKPLFLPVPLKNLFEHLPPEEGSDTKFDLELDDTFGSGKEESEDTPSDAAFQFVVFTSPEELQISLDKRDGSHWELIGCDDTGDHDGEHAIKMVCTRFDKDSNCHKIHLGHGVPGTILQMPPGCGPGKYAVAKTFTEASIQNAAKILPRHLRHLASSATVYDLVFDYDFLRVPRDLGDTQVRIDYSNQENYWDEVVAASLSKRGNSPLRFTRSLPDAGGSHVEWLEQEFREDLHHGALSARDLHERWFGKDILDWLVRMSKPKIHREFTHDIDESVIGKIVDEHWDCELGGGVGTEGHVTIQALANIQVSTSFGFTLIIRSLSPDMDISGSYLTFYNKGKITATLTFEAVARLYFNEEMEIVTLPFPGAAFRIPGIATVGPHVRLVGAIDASVELAATVEATVDLASWEIRQTLPKTSGHEFDPDPIHQADSKDSGLRGVQKPEFYAGVRATGDVSAHLKVFIEFGIRFDDRWKVGAAGAAIVADGYVRATVNSAISTQETCPFTYGAALGTEVYAEVHAPDVFDWEAPRFDIWTPKERSLAESGTCPSLDTDIPTKLRRRDVSGSLFDDDSFSSGLSPRGLLQKRVAVYGPAISLPIAKLICPATGSPENNASCSEIGEQDTWGVENQKRDVLINHPGGGIQEASSPNSLSIRAPKKTTVCGILLMSGDFLSWGKMPVRLQNVMLKWLADL